MRAAIYARFSCSSQREASIDDQLRVCREHCEKEGFEVVAEYCDYALSGRTDNRPQFQKMIAEADTFDYVVVYMMDRFSRDPYDAPIYKKELKRRGVSVVSALERIDQTPDGVIMEKLLEGLAARESMVTSIRTKRGMEGNARAGRYNGDRVYGYSVVDGFYEIDESEARNVRLAFDMRLNGRSYSCIARELASLGVETYRGNPCSPTMAQNMISNEKYVGVYKWGDVRIEGGMPAIIDRAVFDRAQAVRGAKDRKSEKYERYALSGKIVCAECGSNLSGVSGYNSKKVKYTYYRCPKNHFSMRRDAVENTIVGALRDILDSDEAYVIAREVKTAWESSRDSSKLDKALEKLENAQRARDNLLDAIESGLPYEAVRERLERASKEIERASCDIELHRHDAEFCVDDFVDFLRFGATLDDSTLLDAFVFQVIAFEDKLAVTLNYDENETPKRLDLSVFELETYGSPYIRVCEHTIYLVISLAA